MTLYSSQDLILNSIFTAKSDLFNHHQSLILGGGTALARAFLNHRVSYDLDFFVDEPFQPDTLYQHLVGLGLDVVSPPITEQSGTFAHQLHTALNVEGEIIKVSFIEDLFSGMFEQHRVNDGWITEEISGLYHRKIRTLSGTGTQTNSIGMETAQGGRQQARDLFDLYVLSNEIGNISSFVSKINAFGAGVPLSQLRQGLAAIPWMALMDDFSDINTIPPFQPITAMEAKRFFDQTINELTQLEQQVPFE